MFFELGKGLGYELGFRVRVRPMEVIFDVLMQITMFQIVQRWHVVYAVMYLS